MRIAIKETKVYRFEELSEKAKQKVIDNWYEHEDYPFLSENLTEFVKEQLKDNKIEINKDFKVYCSLSYSQGDGLCFVGYFNWKGYYISIKQHGHYYHSNSVTIEMEKDYNSDVPEKDIKEFEAIYKAICYKAERAGYAEIDYRMNFEEFADLAESNSYEFTEDGKIY